jgi:hypothetical protein
MRRVRADKQLARWTFVITASLVLMPGGVRQAYAQQRPAAGGLTLEDRSELLALYATYARYFDFPDVNTDDFVKRVWTPDAEFVNITLKPASGQCPAKATNPPGDWKPGTRDMIKGSVSDKLGLMDVCIGVIRGYQEMALRAVRNFSTVGAVHRTRVGNIYLEKTPEGAYGLATANYWDGDASPAGGKWNGSGVYEEYFVKTGDGWRIKKRVFTGDTVLVPWKLSGGRTAAVVPQP